MSNNLNVNFEAAIAEDRERLKISRNNADRIDKWAGKVIENIFNTLFLGVNRYFACFHRGGI